MSDLTAEMIRKIATQAAQDAIRQHTESLSIGKNDTPLVPGAPKTSVQDLRDRDGHDMAARQSLESLTDQVMRDIRSMSRNRAETFIGMSRKLAKIPGITNVKAQDLAMKMVPGSYKNYLDRQNAGEKMPVIFPRPTAADYKARANTALSRGGWVR